MAEAQGLSLSLAVVDAVDESEGAGEGLREGAGEPEGPIVVEGLEDADSALERVAVGSGERVLVPLTVAEAQPVCECARLPEGPGLPDGVRDAVLLAEVDHRVGAEGQRDTEGHALAVANAFAVEDTADTVPAAGDGEASAEPLNAPEAQAQRAAARRRCWRSPWALRGLLRPRCATGRRRRTRRQ